MFIFCVAYSNMDNNLMSNIQKLFSEKIEIFSAVEFSKVSVLTGIVKISLKVRFEQISKFLKEIGIVKISLMVTPTQKLKPQNNNSVSTYLNRED